LRFSFFLIRSDATCRRSGFVGERQDLFHEFVVIPPVGFFLLLPFLIGFVFLSCKWSPGFVGGAVLEGSPLV